MTRDVTLEAAHMLPKASLSPKCERLHGHRYRVSATWGVGTHDSSSFKTAYAAQCMLNDEGMLVDFSVTKLLLQSVHDLFDHRFINEVELPPVKTLPEFAGFNPFPGGLDKTTIRGKHYASTAENLCLWIGEYLAELTPEAFYRAGLAPAAVARLMRVTVEETQHNVVTRELGW